jgi:arsenate reductase
MDISGGAPRLLTQEMVDRTSRVITMDCSLDEACLATTVPTAGWGLADAADRPIAEVRDLIEQKVRGLLAER